MRASVCYGKTQFDRGSPLATRHVQIELVVRRRTSHMSDKFTFSSAGEIQEVEFALARAGYTHPEVKELTKGAMLGLVREVITGKAEICRIERLASTEATSIQSAD